MIIGRSTIFTVGGLTFPPWEALDFFSHSMAAKSLREPLGKPPCTRSRVNLKTLRVCLLVLLAVVLPVRGVLAATMLCPSGSPLGAAQGLMSKAHEHMGMDEDSMDGSAAAPLGLHQHSDAWGKPAHQGGFEKCVQCCDFCSITPLVASEPTIATPSSFSVVHFLDLIAQRPNFLSDGQERPPRTI